MGDVLLPDDETVLETQRQLRGNGETFEMEVVTNVEAVAWGVAVTKRNLSVSNGLIVSKGTAYTTEVKVAGYAT